MADNEKDFAPLPRGVYLASFTLHGDRYYYAVDDFGNHVGMRTVPIGADPTFAIDELWDVLDAIPSQHDVRDLPSSHLRLIS